jgi:hypothetical protein
MPHVPQERCESTFGIGETSFCDVGDEKTLVTFNTKRMTRTVKTARKKTGKIAMTGASPSNLSESGGDTYKRRIS